MTARSLKTRVKKLEALRKRMDTTLVVWCYQEEEVSSALSKASYAPGDRVMCLEWYGDGPIPEPKWHRDVCNELNEEEDRSLEIMIRKSASNKAETDEAEPCRSSDELVQYSDSELLYFWRGVAT